MIMDSDHNIVWLQIDGANLFEKNKSTSKKQQSEVRRIYLYHKATRENWEAYEHKVEKIIMNSEKRKRKAKEIIQENIEESIDESWEVIAKAITIAANECIPSIKTQNTKCQIRKE